MGESFRLPPIYLLLFLTTEEANCNFPGGVIVLAFSCVISVGFENVIV